MSFIKLLEDWINKIDNNDAGVVFKKLSLRFGCIQEDLLVVKLGGYDFIKETVTYI